MTASPCAAKASFNSMTSILADIASPASAKHLSLRPERRPDAHDAGFHACHRPGNDASEGLEARGHFAAASDAINSAQAPSLIPEALPAVIVPSLRTIGSQLREPFQAWIRVSDVHR